MNDRLHNALEQLNSDVPEAGVWEEIQGRVTTRRRRNRVIQGALGVLVVLAIDAFRRPEVRDGFLLQTLRDEQRLCNRVGLLPDDWSFEEVGFIDDGADLEAVIFGASEYYRDGLLRITELQLPGKRAMAAGDFINANSIQGTVLGTL